MCLIIEKKLNIIIFFLVGEVIESMVSFIIESVLQFAWHPFGNVIGHEFINYSFF